MCGKHIAGSSPLLISSIYFKAGPAGILIVCSSAEKGTRKLLESFKVLCVPEIQRTGKRVIADVLVVALGDAVLILIENGQKYTFVQKGLFQLGAFLLEFLFRTALVQCLDGGVGGTIGVIERVGTG